MFKLKHTKTNKALWLVEPQVTIGSASGNDFILPALGVKSEHCAIYNVGGKLSIEGLDGAIVYVNDQQLHSKSKLTLGDTIRFSNHEFVLFDPAAESRARRQAAKPLALTVQKQVSPTNPVIKKPSKAKQQAANDRQTAQVVDEGDVEQRGQLAILLTVTAAVLFALLVLWFLLL